MDFFEYLDSKGGFYYEVRLYPDTVSREESGEK
jgi:hypothetical protein